MYSSSLGGMANLSSCTPSPVDRPERLQMNPCLAVLASCLLVAAAGDDPAQKGAEPVGERIVEPFDYQGVTLDTGPLKNQVDEVRAFYLAISDDDLLKGFRTRAGKPAPGKDLGGWYSADEFHVFGQIVSGLSRLHAATGDPACRNKTNRLIDEWAKCIEPDGYFYASRKPNAPHYIYDKMLWGLLDANAYCGNGKRWSPRAGSRTGPSRTSIAQPTCQRHQHEWYTLSENLYRAYLATGEAKYREFAKVWEYPDYWDIYARKATSSPSGRSGPQRLPTTPTATSTRWAERGPPIWRRGIGVTSISSQCLRVLAAEPVLRHRGVRPGRAVASQDGCWEKLGETHSTFETQCGSWAAFKLAKYLISLTGDARYGDWIERLVCNGIGASIPMTPDGHVFYYSDYNLHGATKKNTDFGWSCCTGTRPQAVADYTDLVYFRDSVTLYVNLFTPSTVVWKQGGEPVKVTQTTAFPASDEVRLKLDLMVPSEFGIQVRTPGWLAGPVEARVNGEAADLRAGKLHWTGLRRVWRGGDVISLRLPMKLWSSRLDPRRSTPAAVLYGPVVLAFEAPSARMLGNLDLTVLDRVLTPVAGQPLHYRLAGSPSVIARPFASYGPDQRYFVYLNPEMGRRIPHTDLKFTGHWNNAGVFRFSKEVGATVEGEFEGTEVKWLGRRFDDAGTAEASIDDRVVGIVDQYGPGRDLPFDWSHRGLSPGRHKIRIRILAEKPKASSDRFINVAGLEVLTDKAP